jgi:hypothetical protein
VFPLDAMPHLQNALGWAGQGNVEGVMQLQYLSVAAAPGRDVRAAQRGDHPGDVRRSAAAMRPRAPAF